MRKMPSVISADERSNGLTVVPHALNARSAARLSQTPARIGATPKARHGHARTDATDRR